MGRPAKSSEEKFVRQNISMDPAQLQQVVTYCQEQERSISWVIRKALDNYFTVKSV